MPIWGAGSNRSNSNTAHGGAAEVNIRIATETQASTVHSKRGGASSAEEARRLKLENDALELKLARDKQADIDSRNAWQNWHY